MDILEGRSNGKSNDTASKPEIEREEEAMSLPNLIALLAEQQQFDEQLLIDSLDREGITRSNFSAQSHRKAMTSILKKCGFDHQSAVDMVKQIETNISPQKALSNGHGPSYRSDAVAVSNGGDTELSEDS